MSSDYIKEYVRRPEVKERNRLWWKTPAGKAAAQRYNSSEKTIARKKAYTKGIRLAVLEAYGNKCACCSEDKFEFLSLDHINGGGNQHKKLLGSTQAIFRWVKKNNYPEGFRILCHNCNQSLGAYKYCPHHNL